MFFLVVVCFMFTFCGDFFKGVFGWFVLLLTILVLGVLFVSFIVLVHMIFEWYRRQTN